MASKDKALALAKEIEKEGVQALPLQADQSNPMEVDALVKKVGKHFGRIDILVNNAGIYVGGSIDDPILISKGIKRQLAVNVGGFLQPHMRRLLLCKTGDDYYHRFDQWGADHSSGGADYAATKAALVGYTHGWARDLGAKNITVNLIQPGPIDTDMNPDNTEFAER